MANIELQGLYEMMQRRFNCVGSGLSRFNSDFIDAVNMARSDINMGADLTPRIPAIASATDTLALDSEYLGVLADIVTVKLVNLGQKTAY
ncbi:MAG: hypothetical protein ACOYOU_18340, partial [Kiritimatiellia bacterium]